MTRRFKFLVASTSTCLVFVLLFGAMRGKSASPEDTYRHLAVYTEVLSRIKSDYVEEPDMKSVTLGALNGLLESIDPYASYLSADQYKQWLKSKDEQKASVGLVLSKKFGYVGIVDSIPGSPAAKAGLTTTDVLETINGVATRDMPLAFAELLLEGDPGTTVELGVLRFRKPEPQKLTLTRVMIQYPSVTAKMLPDQVGLIQAASLEGDRVKDIASKVEDLQKQGAKDLILDLRNCATGDPEKGEQLANLFLDKGLITYTQGQKVPRHDVTADPANDRSHLPLAVIVDRGTADGAEVAAAALMDDKRAEVVGEPTYGDASIRKAITMDDGSAVILSVAKYYSPDGKAIQDTRVTPSVPVQETEPVVVDDDGNPQAAEPPQQPSGEDMLLKKAIEVVTKGKSEVVSNPNTSAADSKLKDRPPIPLTPLNVPKPEQK
ncbi:MAG: PDZ domain-containing protein [Bryobacterales bacterium]|nr:PDZ domain-containing protein [Bryobacterales bacterium]